MFVSKVIKAIGYAVKVAANAVNTVANVIDSFADKADTIERAIGCAVDSVCGRSIAVLAVLWLEAITQSGIVYSVSPAIVADYAIAYAIVGIQRATPIALIFSIGMAAFTFGTYF